jgi:hypothetical protein
MTCWTASVHGWSPSPQGSATCGPPAARWASTLHRLPLEAVAGPARPEILRRGSAACRGWPTSQRAGRAGVVAFALGHPGFGPARSTPPPAPGGKHPVQQPLCPVVGGRPGAELAQHRGVKVGVGKLQAQGVLPVDPAADRTGRLWRSDSPRQTAAPTPAPAAPGGPPGSPDHDRSREALILEQLTERVTHPDRQASGRERRRDLCGHRRDRTAGPRPHRDRRPLRVCYAHTAHMARSSSSGGAHRNWPAESDREPSVEQQNRDHHPAVNGTQVGTRPRTPARPASVRR